MYILDIVDRVLYKVCPFFAGGVFLGSVYWTLVTYGAVSVMQVILNCTVCQNNPKHYILRLKLVSQNFVMCVYLFVVVLYNQGSDWKKTRLFLYDKRGLKMYTGLANFREVWYFFPPQGSL